MRKVIENKLIEIVNNNFSEIVVDKEQLNMDLSKVGFDSIKFIQMIVLIEDMFQVEIPDEYLLISELKTLNAVIDVIEKGIYEKTEGKT